MNSLKTVLATLFVLGALALLGWGAMVGVGYLQELLAPIDTTTMALVVAGWIGLWGTALIGIVGVRFVYGRAARKKRRERRADIYAYLLDTWATTGILEDLPADASESTRENYANVHTTQHREAERRLALYGSPSVIEAYTDATAKTGDVDELFGKVLVQMRRDLGYSTFSVDKELLLDLLGTDLHSNNQVENRTPPVGPVRTGSGSGS